MSTLLQLPCALGGPVGSGRLRSTLADFTVREWLGFEADAEGEHWLLRVRKRGANTLWVAKQLSKLGNIHPRDVGFAGLKDRNALTEQSFTVPVRSALGANWVGVGGDGFEVIGAARHRRKLKRGALRGNDFEIIVREFDGAPEALTQRLAAAADRGVPNYFGPQRFGLDGGNLTRAQRWFDGEIEIHDREERSFALSAARAALFNAILAQRVVDGTWDRLLAGEVANLNGSQSIFPLDVPDDVLRRRCSEFDIHPTGALHGQGAASVQGAVAALEAQVLAQHATLRDGLLRMGLQAQRRALRVRPSELDWNLQGSDLTLRFRLPRGAYATTVLHELLDNVFTQPSEAEEE